MSYKKENRFALLRAIGTVEADENLPALFRETLESGMHGIGFSAYTEGQEPGDQLSEGQIRRRMEILKPYTKWVRSFSCTDGNELIPQIAHENGLKTMVGAWLGTDADKNEREIESLISLAKAGHVDIAAVGNEVLYRGDLSLEELLGFIHRVKEAIPNIPVGYVDAYYEFSSHPEIVDATDVILANCYPYWEGCHIDYSLLYMKDMFNQAVRAAKGKRVIISETGWPNKGESFKDSHPSDVNFMRYFINTQIWSANEDIEIFYFSSFDEPWKVGAEGDVGAYWGLWDKDENLKF
ncbi:MAG: glycosyl hydrolase [Balneola sp.]|nr:MAG: glycosyl hydrolase [Balneola sp.]